LATPDAAALCDAIEVTFATRGTHAPPKALPAAPAGWSIPYRRLAEEVGVPGELASGHAEAPALIRPILAREVTAGIWDPDGRVWRR
jgi:hypothetical protein